MKRLSSILICVTGILTVVLTARAASAAEAPGRAGLVKIADGVYAYVDEKNPSPATGFGANAGIVIGTDGVAVVDTLASAKEAQRFIKDIRAVTDKPFKYVINTHHHLDHSLGNSEFVKQGAVVIAQERSRADAQKDADTIIRRALNYGFTPEMMEGTTVVLPTIMFSDRMTIDLGGRTVELVYPGPSHTAGSIAAFVPDQKVLFTGDILFTNVHPNMRDADVNGWIKALDAVAALNAEKIVPGHGPLSSKKDLEDMKQYLLLFDRKAKELAAGSNDANAIAAELVKALPHRDHFEMFIAGNVKALYLNK